MKVLVAIASYGRKNDPYLSRVLDQYRSMPYDIDIVVLSNLPKDLGPDVEVVVGLPSKNPWSLPFAHKRIFAERLNRYDLFIYSEDDILITSRNIDAFLRMTGALLDDEIAGFLRSEISSDGIEYFPDVHGHFHWDTTSLRSRGGDVFAHYTNEHSACFFLTKAQLRRAIESGGFLVGPHEKTYDMLCSAATDPYTQCGFTKLVCVSHLDDFVVAHLSNKYAGRLGLEKSEFYKQIEALLHLQNSKQPRAPLFEPRTKIFHAHGSKDYYEPCDNHLLALVPKYVRAVLSVGCGWGKLEEQLVTKGMRVLGVPMDPVIAVCAEARGVQIIEGDFETARKRLANDRFDCILFSNVLHLVHDPVQVLSSFVELLSARGRVVASVPNFSGLVNLWRVIRHYPNYNVIRNFAATGIHPTNTEVVRDWFKRSHLTSESLVYIVPEQWNLADRLSLGVIRKFLASELLATGKRQT